jgi:hypothetical protein
MARIIAPNKQYDGVSATVPFIKGVGQTDNPHLINWFKSNGYTVEASEVEAKPKKKSEEKKPIEEE